MENLQSLGNTECVELERLATAAASMDYNSPLSPSQVHNSKELDSHTQVLEPSHNDVRVTHSSASTQIVPHVVSYIDPVHISKDQSQFPLRNYGESQQYLQDQTQTVQSIPGSRVVMVTGNDNSTNNILFNRNIAPQFTFYQVYPNDNGENCIQTSYSQPVAPSRVEIESYKHSNLEISDSGENSQLSGPSECVSLKNNLESANKNTSRRENKTETTLEDQNGQETDLVSSEASFVCNQCSLSFENESTFKEHQSEHNIPKRTGLSLELKIEIIKRINAGERKSDMAEEYGVNTSTIKSIMKKADSYLNCWKKGMFKPDSKRLKGPKREDVEEAIYSWYQQAIENETQVSGPILCAKALDFAKKLGHADFKPTHGWLDRFKKRKKIVFGRSSCKKRREDKIQEPYTSLLPQMLNDYDSQNIFALELFGLCYRTLPSNIDTLKGLKCAGGVKSKERFSIVLCSNMTGIEKFPLLVVGRCQPNNFAPKISKNLPVHFIFDRYSWLTSEIISSWLLDMDSWFVQQGRKIILLAPPSPVFSQLPKFRAVKFVVLPQGCPSPLRQSALPCFKKYYRKKFLEELLLNASRTKSHAPQLSVVTCLHLLSTAWQNVTENVIVSSFQRAGLTKYCVWGMIVPTDNSDVVGSQEIFISALHMLNSSSENTFDDYVHFDNNVQVCNLMDDEDILAKVRGIRDDDDEASDESQEKMDRERPTLTEVENAVGVLRKYIQYQEGAQEMFRVLSHLEYIIYKNVSEELM